MLTEPGDSPDPEITALIQSHELLDQTVLAAYGWSDIEVPPFPNPTTEEERERLQAFEDEIIDRLFALNAQRALIERILGPSRSRSPDLPAKKKTLDFPAPPGRAPLEAPTVYAAHLIHGLVLVRGSRIAHKELAETFALRERLQRGALELPKQLQPTVKQWEDYGFGREKLILADGLDLVPVEFHPSGSYDFDFGDSSLDAEYIWEAGFLLNLAETLEALEPKDATLDLFSIDRKQEIK
jgi:hypothetical protein